MVTTGNGTPTPEGPDRRTSESRQADGNPAADNRTNSDSARSAVDNEELLDEIETLLHELSTEYTAADKPGTKADGQDQPAARSAKLPQGPNLTVASGYDLAKPVDYVADATRYDYRRASESQQAEVNIRSMAQRLAPNQEPTRHEPSVTESEIQAAAPAQAPIAQAPDDQPYGLEDRIARDLEADMADADGLSDAERANNLRRRKLRLRPARRVPGSRPEAQFATYPTMNQTPDSEWDPRMARSAVVQSSGARNGMIGAGVMLLLVAGAAGAFTFIDPLNRLLPGNGADQDRLAVAAADSARTGETFDLASGAGGTGDPVNLQTAGQLDNGTAPAADSGPVETALAAVTESGQAETATGGSGLQPAIPVDTATSAQPAADLQPAMETGAAEDKSPERLNQDSVIQAMSQDPQKRALGTPESGATEDGAADGDPILTGSIGQPPADEQIRGANAVARQASASHAGRVSKRTIESEETVKVAGLAPNAPFGVIQGEAQAPSQIVETTPPTEPEQPQQVARTENTDLNTVDVNRTVPGASNSTGDSAPLHGSSVDTLLTRGHELLKQGDIASARLLFQRVVAMGDSRGAKGMGMTYDPRVFEGLPVAGMTADIEQAEYWYQKAREFSAAKQTPDVSETDRMPASGN